MSAYELSCTECMEDFFLNFKKYPKGFLKSFIVFFKEKSQKNKTYFINILVQIILKEYYIFIGEIGEI